MKVRLEMMVYVLFSVTPWGSCLQREPQALQGCADSHHRGSWHQSCQWVPKPRLFQLCCLASNFPVPAIFQHTSHAGFIAHCSNIWLTRSSWWPSERQEQQEQTGAHTLGGCQVNALGLSPARSYLGLPFSPILPSVVKKLCLVRLQFLFQIRLKTVCKARLIGGRNLVGRQDMQALQPSSITNQTSEINFQNGNSRIVSCGHTRSYRSHEAALEF